MNRTYLPRRLVGFWPLQEAAGNRVNAANPGVGDLVPTGGVVSQVTGPSPPAIPFAAQVFGAAGGYLVSLATPFNFSGPFTMVVVAKVLGGNFDLLFQCNANGGLGSLLQVAFTIIAPLQLQVSLNDPTQIFAVNAGGALPAGFDSTRWHMYHLEYDGDQLQLWADVDTPLFCALWPSGFSPAPQDWFGPGNIGGNNSAQLAGCNLGLWSRLLSRGELLELFNGGTFLPYPF